MTPVERLRAAAQVIRDTAAKATPGPWEADGGEVYQQTDRTWVGETLADDDEALTEGNAAWIALLGPDKAPDLADLLDHAADVIEDATGLIGQHLDDALTFADNILPEEGAA